MLIDNLYTVDRLNSESGKTEACITINASHKIFNGHFPGQPVLPGVCQLQIIKELLEKTLNKKLFLSEAAQCKFLQMIDPVKTNQVIITIDYKITEDIVTVNNAVIKNGATVFLKMSSRFEIVE